MPTIYGLALLAPVLHILLVFADERIMISFSFVFLISVFGRANFVVFCFCDPIEEVDACSLFVIFLLVFYSWSSVIIYPRQGNIFVSVPKYR